MALIKPSHQGRLHKALGIARKKKIPVKVLEAKMHSGNRHMRAMARFAMNMDHGGR